MGLIFPGRPPLRLIHSRNWRSVAADAGAEILFAGSAPGPVGILQINARLPGGFVPSGQDRLELTVGTAAAPPLSIWLK